MHGVLIANYRIDLELSRQLSVWNRGAYQWAMGKEKKINKNLFLQHISNILHCKAVLMSVPWSSVEEISRSLWCLISLTDHRKPISDPSYRYDKNLQYNGLFPLLVTSPPKAYSTPPPFHSLLLFTRLPWPFFSLLFRAKQISQVFTGMAKKKTSPLTLLMCFSPSNKDATTMVLFSNLAGKLVAIACW